MKRAKKVPIQIYLEPEQDKVMTVLSKSRGLSKAALIRSCLDKYLGSLPPEEDPAMDILDLGASGKKDISERHDEYLNSFKK